MLRLSRRLDETHRVLRYDRRGYGRSKPHPGPFSMDAQVDDLVELLDGRRALLFGHSYGGNVVARHGATPHPISSAPWRSTRRRVSWLDVVAGHHQPARRGRRASAAEDAAERFMRRLVGDDRWDAPARPRPGRAARRGGGLRRGGHRPRRQRAVGRRPDRRAGGGDVRRAGPRAPPSTAASTWPRSCRTVSRWRSPAPATSARRPTPRRRRGAARRSRRAPPDTRTALRRRCWSWSSWWSRARAASCARGSSRPDRRTCTWCRARDRRPVWR